MSHTLTRRVGEILYHCFYSGHPGRCAVTSHRGFNLHFPSAGDAERHLLCSFAICTSSSVKCLVSFALFLVGLVCGAYSRGRLVDVRFADISPSLWLVSSSPFTEKFSVFPFMDVPLVSYRVTLPQCSIPKIFFCVFS